MLTRSSSKVSQTINNAAQKPGNSDLCSSISQKNNTMGRLTKNVVKQNNSAPIFNIHIHLTSPDGADSNKSLENFQPIIHLHLDNIAEQYSNSIGASTLKNSRKRTSNVRRSLKCKKKKNNDEVNCYSSEELSKCSVPLTYSHSKTLKIGSYLF